MAIATKVTMRRTKKSIEYLKKREKKEEEKTNNIEVLSGLLEEYDIYNEGVLFYEGECPLHGKTLYINMLNEGGHNGTSACMDCLKNIAAQHKNIILKKYLDIEI